MKQPQPAGVFSGKRFFKNQRGMGRRDARSPILHFQADPALFPSLESQMNAFVLKMLHRFQSVLQQIGESLTEIRFTDDNRQAFFPRSFADGHFGELRELGDHILHQAVQIMGIQALYLESNHPDFLFETLQDGLQFQQMLRRRSLMGQAFQ